MNAKDVIQQRSSDQIAADGEQPKSDSGRSNGSGDGLGGSDAVGKDGGPAWSGSKRGQARAEDGGARARAFGNCCRPQPNNL